MLPISDLVKRSHLAKLPEYAFSDEEASSIYLNASLHVSVGLGAPHLNCSFLTCSYIPRVAFTCTSEEVSMHIIYTIQYIN